MKAKETVVVTDPTGRRVAIMAGREVPPWVVPLLYKPQEQRNYDTLTVDELRAEIRARNEGRDEGQHLSAQGRKAELIRALQADDRL